MKNIRSVDGELDLIILTIICYDFANNELRGEYSMIFNTDNATTFGKENIYAICFYLPADLGGRFSIQISGPCFLVFCCNFEIKFNN